MDYRAYTNMSKMGRPNVTGTNTNSCEQFAAPILKKFGVQSSLGNIGAKLHSGKVIPEKPKFERLDSTGNTLLKEFQEDCLFKGLSSSMCNMDRMSGRYCGRGGAIQQPNGPGWLNMHCKYGQAPRFAGKPQPAWPFQPTVRNPNMWTGAVVPPVYPGFNRNRYYYPFGFNNYTCDNNLMYGANKMSLESSSQHSSKTRSDKSKCNYNSGKKVQARETRKMNGQDYEKFCDKMASVNIASDNVSALSFLKHTKIGEKPEECPQLVDLKGNKSQPSENKERNNSCSSFECLVIHNSSNCLNKYASSVVNLQNADSSTDNKSVEGVATMKIEVSDLTKPNSPAPNHFNLKCTSVVTSQSKATPRKKKSKPSQKKRQRLKQQKGLVDNPYVTAFIQQQNQAKRAKTSHQECNETNTENSQTCDSRRSPVAFTFGVDISENKFCDNMQHVQTQVSFTINSSDDSDFDSADCDMPIDDLWESFASPMTFNLTCVATAVGVPVHRRESVSTPVKEANERWQAGLGSDNVPEEDSRSHRKVSFASGVTAVHEVEHWDRKGPWEEFGRDHERFQNRIKEVDVAIGYIFSTDHRNKILANSMVNS